jgi:putative transposase
MAPLNETLAADPGTEIATGALAQSTVVPIDNEPAPTLIVEPPLPGPLAQGVAFIPYRVVTAQIRAVIRTRASYGARRVRALVNREFATRYNLKRIQRVMELHGWKLPRASRRRTGRAHRGLIRRDASNERWCSDVLEIACWNGEIVQLGFVLDCHDREALATVAAPRDLLGTDIQQLMQRAVAARFGEGKRPDAPIQWLSDNGSIYTALDTLITAERLHLVPITTPAASPESNGMSEAFVNTLRRDYFAGPISRRPP